MRAGISTASLFMRRENEDALSLFNEWGIDCAEVFLTSFYQYKRSFGELLKTRQGRVCINSVHDLTSQFEPQLFSAHAGIMRDAYACLAGVLEVGQLLSAPYYSFHGLTRAKRGERNPDKDNFDNLIQGFARLSDFCQGYGITLCLENVEWSTYNREGVFSRIAKEVPAMRGVLDIKQARLSEIPYQTYLREMGEKLAYVHISDVDEKGKMCLPGKGRFDFDELIKRLQGVGFDGALIIEAYAGDYGDTEELKASYEFVKELAYKYSAK